MPIYKATFNPGYAGYPVTVFDSRTLDVVATGTVNGTDLDGHATFSTTQDEGAYMATVGTAPWTGGPTVDCALDIPASIEAGGGVGASETAFFVATGPADVSDGGGNVGPLLFVADDRHGSLPSWADVDESGTISLTSDAGAVAWSFKGVVDFDFSATTAPTASGTVTGGFYATFDATNPDLTNGVKAGDGADLQTCNDGIGGGTGVFSSISVQAFPSADDGGNIPDGVAAPRAALTITRIAQAAVLPA
jgi:hypothetical protein